MNQGVKGISKSYMKVIAVLLCSSFLLYGCGLFSSDSDNEDQLDAASTANKSISGTISVPKTNAQPNLSMSVLNMNVSDDLMNLTDATVCIVDILTQSSMPGLECMKTDSNGQFELPVPSRENVDGQLLVAVKEKTLITAIIDITADELSLTPPVNGDPFTSATAAKVMEIIAEDESAALLAGETVEFDATKQKELLGSIKELAKEVKKEVEKKSLAEVKSVIKLAEAIQLSSAGVFDSVDVMKKQPKLSIEIKSNSITSLKTKMKAKQALYVSNVKIKKAGGKTETIVDKKNRLTNLAATDITLSNMNIAENEAVGTEIGSVSVIDDGIGTNTVTLSGTDASKFTLDGNILKASESFDYESIESYIITLTATDGSLVFSKDITITVTDINEAIIITTIFGECGHTPCYKDGLYHNGNLYMIKNKHTIVKITPDNVESIVVDGSSVFNYIKYMAIDSNNDLFVSDGNDYKIYKVTMDGTITHYAGTGVRDDVNGQRLSAQFDTPNGLAFDSADNLYLADKLANKVKKIAPDGTVTTFATITKPVALVYDSNNNYLIVSGDRDVYKIDMSGNSTLLNAVNIQIESLAIDSAGDIYVPDMNVHKTFKVSPTGESTHWIGNGVWNHDRDGEVTDDTATTATIKTPQYVVSDNENNTIYISGWFGLKKITF